MDDKQKTLLKSLPKIDEVLVILEKRGKALSDRLSARYEDVDFLKPAFQKLIAGESLRKISPIHYNRVDLW